MTIPSQNQALTPGVRMIAHEYVRRAMLTFNVLAQDEEVCQNKFLVAVSNNQLFAHKGKRAC